MPVRTCVGCRQVDEKSALVRLVWREGSVVVDAAQRLPGRGAYLHAGRPACAAAALRRRAIPRALREGGQAPEAYAGILEAISASPTV